MKGRYYSILLSLLMTRLNSFLRSPRLCMYVASPCTAHGPLNNSYIPICKYLTSIDPLIAIERIHMNFHASTVLSCTLSCSSSNRIISCARLPTYIRHVWPLTYIPWANIISSQMWRKNSNKMAIYSPKLNPNHSPTVTQRLQYMYVYQTRHYNPPVSIYVDGWAVHLTLFFCSTDNIPPSHNTP